MPEQLDAGNDAILAKREAANPVVTSGTQPPATLVTLDNSRVLRMISAIQHYYSALAPSAAAGLPLGHVTTACFADSCWERRFVLVTASADYRSGFVLKLVACSDAGPQPAP